MPPSRGATFVNWPAYLLGSTHSSFQGGATTITPSNAGTVKRTLLWTPPPISGRPSAGLYASPTVVDGVIYIGSNTGYFYALSESTGAVLWQKDLGFAMGTSCGKRGIASTATVAPDPQTSKLVVYVASGNGYLYALKASSGKTVWKSLVKRPSDTLSDYYNWSSPTVVGGRIYMGISSQCDDPLVRGGVKEFDQATGAKLHTYYSMPKGSLGGSVWSSAASDGSNVWVTTGNSQSGQSEQGDSFSIVRLSADTLKRQEKWTVPGQEGTDRDWGGSPTLFSATLTAPTPMVGSCDKDGNYYALRQTDLAAGPVWHTLIGSPPGSGNDICIAAAIWDGARLFAAGNRTVIGGKSFKGSVRRLNPATGHLIWSTGVTAGPILGSPSLDGSGVIAAATWSTGSLYLIDAKDGTVDKTDPLPSQVFAQPVFADQYLFVATATGGLFRYSP